MSRVRPATIGTDSARVFDGDALVVIAQCCRCQKRCREGAFCRLSRLFRPEWPIPISLRSHGPSPISGQAAYQASGYGKVAQRVRAEQNIAVDEQQYRSFFTTHDAKLNTMGKRAVESEPKRVVEQEYNATTDSWTASINKTVVTGRTPRQVRAEVARVLGPEVEVEYRIKLDRGERAEFAAIAKEGAAVEDLRMEYAKRLDKLNVRRLAAADKLLARRATMDMIAEILGMLPNRVQQLTDPRHYAGQRVRALREGRIEPGSPPDRGGNSGGGDE